MSKYLIIVYLPQACTVTTTTTTTTTTSYYYNNNNYYKPRYLIIGYLDPLGKVHQVSGSHPKNAEPESLLNLPIYLWSPHHVHLKSLLYLSFIYCLQMYIYIYTCMHTHMHAYMHTYIHMCVYTCIYIYIL